MRDLRAVLFGIDTLFDQREIEREAFNGVFEEAGLPWRWEPADYARLLRHAAGGDVLDAFIRFERPFWRNSEDMKHLLAAVRRRHASLCSLAHETSEADRDMAAAADAVRRNGLRACAIVPFANGLALASNGIAVAKSHGGALAEMDVPATACVAIECTPQGFAAAAKAGIDSLDKAAVTTALSGLSDVGVITLLREARANALTVSRSRRFMPALFA